MALKRLSAACEACVFKDTCTNKRMEALGFFEPAAQPILNLNAEHLAAPVIYTPNMRDIDINLNTTIKVNSDDIIKEITNSIYKELGVFFNGA